MLSLVVTKDLYVSLHDGHFKLESIVIEILFHRVGMGAKSENVDIT